MAAAAVMVTAATAEAMTESRMSAEEEAEADARPVVAARR
jgi:hypothetical protein